MGKHAADKPHTPPKGGRLKHYTEVEQGSGPHKQTEALQKRPRDRPAESSRAKEFMRIERGERA